MRKVMLVLSLSLVVAVLFFTIGVSAQSKQALDFANMRMVDLSHVQDANMPSAAEALKPPTREFFLRVDEGGTHNLEIVSYCPHTGTHMDSPFHVTTDGITIEAMDPELMIGYATVLSFDVSGPYTITLSDIKAWEKVNGEIPEGDGILIDTKQDELWDKGKTEYIDNGYPILSSEAAEYIASKKARYVGMEFISPEGNTQNIHKTLMNNGVAIIENLKDLSKIGATRCYTIGTFPAMDGATGVYVRLLAYVPK